MNMNPTQMLRGMVAISNLASYEVYSRALREVSLKRVPWHKRIFIRLAFARAFKRRWKAEVVKMEQRIVELRAAAKRDVDGVDLVLDATGSGSGTPFAN